MSNVHRYKQRGENGKLLRKYQCRRAKYSLGTPRWWRKLFFTRPLRRANRIACMKIMHGVEYDGLPLPLGNHKPHEYYW